MWWGRGTSARKFDRARRSVYHLMANVSPLPAALSMGIAHRIVFVTNAWSASWAAQGMLGVPMASCAKAYGVHRHVQILMTVAQVKPVRRTAIAESLVVA